MHSFTLFVTLLCLWLPCHAQRTDKLVLEKEILDKMLSPDKYDARHRPSGGNETGPLVVRTNIYVRRISKLDDLNMEYDVQLTFRQQWRDNRLTYSSPNPNLRYLTVADTSLLWTPDVFFTNERKAHFHNVVKPNTLMRIYPNGDILYSVRISMTLSCPMDLRYFPLDNQMCSIVLASYGYTTDDLVFLWKEGDPVQVTKNLHLPKFTLQLFSTDYCTSRTNTGEYTCLKVDFLFHRNFEYYLVHIYMPYVFMVLLSWIPFWLDYRATTARVAIWVTILLAMIIMTASIQWSTPAVSYTRSIDVWTGMCLVFLSAVIIELAVVTQAMVQEEKKPLMSIDDSSSAEKVTRKGGKLDRLRVWFNRYQSQAMKIDVVSRFGFPLAFLLFNIFYWSSYAGRG